ncbi:MAG: alpha/beta hydrolase family protein [Phycisphaerales bacterium]
MAAPQRNSSPYPLPSALAAQTRFVKLGRAGVPTLLAHPDWKTPCPTVIWMHGRTVSKELDNGRYLRWIRAGIAACAIDLPGHGERYEIDRQQPDQTLGVLAQAIGEIDGVIEALADPAFGGGGAFDLDRLGIGGMSAGGMVTLRRLCDDHPFVCVAVESTAGNLEMLYGGIRASLVAAAPAAHAPDRIEPLDPIRHIDGWRPIPLLALHSNADQVVPVECISSFIDAVRASFPTPPNPDPILHTWDQTGAPDEHSGFGRMAAEAKTRQVEFFTRVFDLSAPNPQEP